MHVYRLAILVVLVAVTTTVITLAVTQFGVFSGVTREFDHSDGSDVVLATVTTYTSTQTGDTATLTTGPDGTTLVGAGFRALPLTPVPGEHFGHFDNRSQEVNVDAHGRTLVVRRGQEILFRGTQIIDDSMSGYSATTSPEPKAVVSPTESIVTAPAILTSGAWWWVESLDPIGTITKPFTSNTFSLTFTTAGELSGTTDCNRFGGSFTYETQKIITGPLAATKMYCENSQEGLFVSWLTRGPLTIVDLTDNTLTLLTSDNITLRFTAKLN